MPSSKLVAGVNPAAIAQGVGLVTGGVGTLLIGAAQAKQAFGGKSEPTQPQGRQELVVEAPGALSPTENGRSGAVR
jgi:hypothetical protein